MTITVNGKSQTLDAACTIAEYLTGRGLDPAKVVVEQNKAIVPRETFGDTMINDGDTLEVVSFVGGG